MKHNWELGPDYDIDGFRKEGGKIKLYGKGGGGSPAPAPTTQTVSQTNIPPELMPYATANLAQASEYASLAFYRGGDGYGWCRWYWQFKRWR